MTFYFQLWNFSFIDYFFFPFSYKFAVCEVEWKNNEGNNKNTLIMFYTVFTFIYFWDMKIYNHVSVYVNS